MIDKLYYYLIKTKYSKFKRSDIIKLEELHIKAKKNGIYAISISGDKKSAIEFGLLGRELTEKFRHVDNYIFSNNSIIESFIENEKTFEAGMKRLGGEIFKL